MTPSSSLFALACLLAASPLAAQTFVVDALGGPGANFTDLPAAIAFAPSGATLRVRAGTYSPFQIVNKGLHILGENTAGTFPTVRLTSAGSTITIGPLGANHAVTICGRPRPRRSRRRADWTSSLARPRSCSRTSRWSGGPSSRSPIRRTCTSRA